MEKPDNVTSLQDGKACDEELRKCGEQTSLQEDIPTPGKNFYITRDENGQATLRTRNIPLNQKPLKRDEKMNFLRNRMTLIRKKKKVEEKLIREKFEKKGKLKPIKVQE